jgi:hypothetical protein
MFNFIHNSLGGLMALSDPAGRAKTPDGDLAQSEGRD